jgi:16S rRNA (guanine966-N2)-methyltransferase
MTGKVRIISGQWRGRKIPVVDRPGLRPTGDRVRETLFNWIGPRIVGARVVDLFAGSGALGLEAASRGASSVVLIECDRVAAQTLRDGPLTWPGAEQVCLIETDALRWLRESSQTSDLIMIDPPFGTDLLADALVILAQQPNCLNAGGMLYVECAPDQAPEDWPEHMEVLKQKRVGQVLMTLLKRRV